MADTILQSVILTRFAFPFLLVFFIVFAILEKTKILGDGNRQIDALVAFIIGLIFVTFAYPVDVVSNLVLFLTIALITMFVGLLIWGFIIGGEAKVDSKAVKIAFAVVVTISVIVAVIWATGAGNPLYDWFFKQKWSGEFWTNLTFIVVIAIALGMVLKGKAGGN